MRKSKYQHEFQIHGIFYDLNKLQNLPNGIAQALNEAEAKPTHG